MLLKWRINLKIYSPDGTKAIVIYALLHCLALVIKQNKNNYYNPYIVKKDWLVVFLQNIITSTMYIIFKCRNINHHSKYAVLSRALITSNHKGFGFTTTMTTVLIQWNMVNKFLQWVIDITYSQDVAKATAI